MNSPTKTMCPFTQYMVNKPDMFGIKFFLAVDTTSNYFVNGFPYVGKVGHQSSYTLLSEQGSQRYDGQFSLHL